MRITNILANIFSAIFQPIFIPMYGIILLSIADPVISNFSAPVLRFLWLVIFTTTALIPLMVVVGGRMLGLIGDTFISNRKERPLPYILSLASYIVGIIILSNKGLHFIYIAPFIGSTITLVAIFVVNFWWKISAHMSAMGGLTGGILAYNFLFLHNIISIMVITILISGIVGWSRMKLKAHTLAQVGCGWLTGFLCVFLSWIIIGFNIF